CYRVFVMQLSFLFTFLLPTFVSIMPILVLLMLLYLVSDIIYCIICVIDIRSPICSFSQGFIIDEINSSSGVDSVNIPVLSFNFSMSSFRTRQSYPDL